MILECIILGAIGGLIISSRKKTFLGDLNFSGLWISIIGALVFYLSLDLSLRANTNISIYLLKNFSYIHFIALFLMAIGMIVGKKHIGKLLVGLGFLFNGLVVLVNGKMPVSPVALKKISDIKTLELLKDNRVLTHTLMENTHLNVLGDIIAYDPPFSKGKVMSIGDVLIALGVGIIVASYVSFMTRRG